MLDSLFDSLTRRLGATTSRRDAVRLLFAGVASLSFAPFAVSCSRGDGRPTAPQLPSNVDPPELPEVKTVDLVGSEREAVRTEAEENADFKGISDHFSDWGFLEEAKQAYQIVVDGAVALAGLTVTMTREATAERALLYYGHPSDGPAAAHAVAVDPDGNFFVGFYLRGDGVLSPIFPDRELPIPPRFAATAAATPVLEVHAQRRVPTPDELAIECHPRGSSCCLCHQTCLTIAQSRRQEVVDKLGGFCTLLGVGGTAAFRLTLTALGLGIASAGCSMLTGPAAARREEDSFYNCLGIGCGDVCRGCARQCSNNPPETCRSDGRGGFACASICKTMDEVGRAIDWEHCKTNEICMEVSSLVSTRNVCVDPEELDPAKQGDPFCNNGVYMGEYYNPIVGEPTSICCPFAGVDCGARSDGTWTGCCPSCCARKNGVTGCVGGC